MDSKIMLKKKLLCTSNLRKHSYCNQIKTYLTLPSINCLLESAEVNLCLITVTVSPMITGTNPSLLWYEKIFQA